MTFEFLVGCPPFNDDSPEKIFDNILTCAIPWNDKIKECIPADAIDFINKLLEYDPKKRLGKKI
jgi:serine/threonine-protein kinase RIM15